MLKVDQDKILSNLSVLVEETDLNSLIPELLRRDVLNEAILGRILNPLNNPKRQKTDLYLEITRRGPLAFIELCDALFSTNQIKLAKLLSEMETNETVRTSSLNLIAFASENSSDDNANDVSFLTSNEEISQPDDIAKPKSVPMCSGNSCTGTSSQAYAEKNQGDILMKHSYIPKNPHHSESKVFSLPAYEKQILEFGIRSNSLSISKFDKINYEIEKNRPVSVKLAIHWQNPEQGRPKMYKMDSNPRGYALIINNEKFDDEELPDRVGSDNDLVRATSLLEQLHFKVEAHQNKTKKEMEDIVKNFSKKPELFNVDSVMVILMSHGQEGASEEDSEILGTDGNGYNTNEIVSQFYNDCCPALIDKPKMFFFQACRGSLPDPGVTIYQIAPRIETDGKKRSVQAFTTSKVRSHSDIFIAYAVSAGRTANRDRITGGWFIQTIVNVFSEYAYKRNLVDLMKMVDDNIKNINNAFESNFQSVTTKTIGWNKSLYFNPGLCRDKITKETIYLNQNPVDHSGNETDEGMDVVDNFNNSGSLMKTFCKWRDDEENKENGGSKNSGCFSVFRCNPI